MKSCKPLAYLSITATLLSTPAMAGEGGFVGISAGTAASFDIDNTDVGAKLFVGANITKNLALEFSYLSLGKASYDDPKAIVPVNDDEAIYFKDAKHGNVSTGEVRDAPITKTDSQEAKPKRDPSTFTGPSEVSPHGATITMRYNFNLADKVDFFLKGGAYVWEADYTELEIEVDENGAETRTERKMQESAVQVITGGGFMWKPIKELGVRAEMETVAIDTAELKRLRYELLSLGIQYEF